MELVIQIRDGMPYEHPILVENLTQAFPGIDIDNLPDNFARFERVDMPELGVYEVYEGLTYEWVGSIVKDVHNVRQMSDEEKTQKQNEIKASWTAYPSWVFNEEICYFEPPFGPPQDGKSYRWNEEVVNWVEFVPEQ